MKLWIVLWDSLFSAYSRLEVMWAGFKFFFGCLGLVNYASDFYFLLWDYGLSLYEIIYFLLWIRTTMTTTTTMLLPCTWSATCNMHNETMVWFMRLCIFLLWKICNFYHSYVYKSFMIMKLWIVLWDSLFSACSRLGSIVGWFGINTFSPNSIFSLPSSWTRLVKSSLIDHLSLCVL